MKHAMLYKPDICRVRLKTLFFFFVLFQVDNQTWITLLYWTSQQRYMSLFMVLSKCCYGSPILGSDIAGKFPCNNMWILFVLHVQTQLYFFKCFPPQYWPWTMNKWHLEINRFPKGDFTIRVHTGIVQHWETSKQNQMHCILEKNCIC